MTTTKKLVLASATIAATMLLTGNNQNVNADVRGTDVSSHQGVINYKANGFNFAFVKATEGTGYVNPYLNAQTVQADKERIPQGAYHYYRTDGGTPEQQARYFINTIGINYAKDPNTMLMLDAESNAWDGNNFRGDEPKRFLDEVHRLTGKKCVVYMNSEFAKGMNGRYYWSDIADYPLMLASYPYSNNTTYLDQWSRQQIASIPWFKKVYIIQYGDGNGFDWDYMYGTPANLIKALNGGMKKADKTDNPTVHKPKNPTPVKKPKPKPVTQKYATFNGVYVLDEWRVWNGKYYGLNYDMSIPVADYNNYIPALPITLTDRYGHTLKNQSIQGNNGRMEFFTLKGKYKVLQVSGKNVKVEIGGEPVWLQKKFVSIK